MCRRRASRDGRRTSGGYNSREQRSNSERRSCGVNLLPEKKASAENRAPTEAEQEACAARATEELLAARRADEIAAEETKRRAEEAAAEQARIDSMVKILAARQAEKAAAEKASIPVTGSGANQNHAT